jgi:Rieske Fe-S protein
MECPLHSGRFDVRTGRATRRPAKRPVTVYECLVEDDMLYVLDIDIAPADPGPAVASRREPATVPSER